MLLAAAVVAVGAVFCLAAGAAPAPLLVLPVLGPRVTVETAAGPATVTVEMAVTTEARARGLMGRESLPPDAGMLFVFPVQEEHAFWMERTLIPLDMIYIGEDGRVTGIVSWAQPLTRTPRGQGLLSRTVLEVNGGWAERRGVRPGDRVRFAGGPAVPGIATGAVTESG